MDESLTALLQRFELEARVFYAGNLCSLAHFDGGADDGIGHLHLFRGGRLDVIGPDGLAVAVPEPTLLFFPRASPHWLRPDPNEGADLVCASIAFGGGFGNPLVRSLPTLLMLPLARMTTLPAILQALFAEAFAEHSGRHAVLDRLCEIVLIHVLRHAVDARLMAGGLIAGLADARLSRALDAIHAEPARDWTLATLAERAGMSRARFAAHFAQVVGTPAAEYLARWRLGLAQALLVRGRPVKSIADDVGYGSANALARAFGHRLGCSPTEWLASRNSARQTAAA